MENKNEVFYLQVEELTPAMNRAETDRLKKLIKTRKTLYRRRLEEKPPMEAVVGVKGNKMTH